MDSWPSRGWVWRMLQDRELDIEPRCLRRQTGTAPSGRCVEVGMEPWEALGKEEG